MSDQLVTECRKPRTLAVLLGRLTARIASVLSVHPSYVHVFPSHGSSDRGDLCVDVTRILAKPFESAIVGSPQFRVAVEITTLLNTRKTLSRPVVDRSDIFGYQIHENTITHYTASHIGIMHTLIEGLHLWFPRGTASGSGQADPIGYDIVEPLMLQELSVFSNYSSDPQSAYVTSTIVWRCAIRWQFPEDPAFSNEIIHGTGRGLI